MSKITILFCISFSILLLNIVAICTAPIINNIIKDSSKWGNRNCKLYSDLYNNYKNDKNYNNNIFENDEKKEKYLSNLKDGNNLCKKKKTMYYFEYISLIVNIIITFVFSLLTLIILLNSKNNENDYNILNDDIIGIIGTICGIICFSLTSVYIIHSQNIFNEGSPGKEYENPGEPNSFSVYNSNKVYKLDEERSFAEWNNDDNIYSCSYYDENDEDKFYIKYNELNKKQYNYNKEIYIYSLLSNSKINKCSCDDNDCNPDIECRLHNKKGRDSRNRYGNNMACLHLTYNVDDINLWSTNKYIYYRWKTTIILGYCIIILYFGLGIYGFYIYKIEN